MRKTVILIIFICSCTTIKRNIWLNQFEICCVMEYSVKRAGDKLDFKDGYFEDDYLKISPNFDVSSGIKLNITNKCGVNSYIKWGNAKYLAEGKYYKVIFNNISSVEDRDIQSTVSILPPFIEIPITVIPQKSVNYKKGIWHQKTLFDISKHPQYYLYKNNILYFSYSCGDNILNYEIIFTVSKRYPSQSN